MMGSIFEHRKVNGNPWCKHDWYYRICPYCEVEELEVELKRLREERSWISVKERQPEKAGRYLVYAEWGRDIGLFMSGQWYILGGNFSGNVEWCKAAVTHWMPLPEPPEGEHEPPV